MSRPCDVCQRQVGEFLSQKRNGGLGNKQGCVATCVCVIRAWRAPMSSRAVEWAREAAPLYRGHLPSCLTSGGLRPKGKDPALRVFISHGGCAFAMTPSFFFFKSNGSQERASLLLSGNDYHLHNPKGIDEESDTEYLGPHGNKSHGCSCFALDWYTFA
jgi:hypothetical protein